MDQVQSIPQKMHDLRGKPPIEYPKKSTHVKHRLINYKKKITKYERMSTQFHLD